MVPHLNHSQTYNKETKAKDQSMPKHNKGFDHHLWVPNMKVDLLALSHHKEWNFTFSSSRSMLASILLYSLLLRSFQTNQMQSNQISWRKDWRALEWPEEWVNWVKWSSILRGSTPDIPIQDLICCHKVPKVGQWINKCGTVSSKPHPVTHMTASASITPRLRRLFLVGNLSRNNRQAKMETFSDTCLCQIRFPVVTSRGSASAWVVSCW